MVYKRQWLDGPNHALALRPVPAVVLSYWVLSYWLQYPVAEGTEALSYLAVHSIAYLQSLNMGAAAATV